MPSSRDRKREAVRSAGRSGARGRWVHFSQGYSSDYWFAFVNQVAKQIKASHPDKHLATLAYGAKCRHPSFPVESNVAVQMCFASRLWECFPHEGENERQIYQSWVDDSKKTGRQLFLWLYYIFPEWNDMSWHPGGRRFHAFPGFFAHAAARQMKQFAEDGVRGVFLQTDCYCDTVDLYLTYKLMDDPSLDTDDLLDEFFARYYGAAGEPMKKLYLGIEETYNDPQNYPAAVRDTEWQFHQTEEIAWGYLGTAERMAEFGALMAQAKAAATTDTERKRVELFEKGVWDYMVAGRKRYLEKHGPAAEAKRDHAKAVPPPSLTIPAVPDAGGDPLKVAWGKALAPGQMVDGHGQPFREGLVRQAGARREIPLRAAGRPGRRHQGGERPGDLGRRRLGAVLCGAAGVPLPPGGGEPGGEDRAAGLRGGLEGLGRGGAGGLGMVENRLGGHLGLPAGHAAARGAEAGREVPRQFLPDGDRGREPAWSPNFDSSFHRLDRLGEFTLE